MTTAEWYDRFYGEQGPLDAGPWYSGVAEHLKRWVPEGLGSKTILEVGSGSGPFVARVAPLGGLVLGIDPSLAACRIAKDRGGAALVATGERLPVRDQSIDIVVCCEVLEHVDSPPRVLREIRRVLKPDGLLLLSFPNYWNLPWLALRLLSDLLRKHNWVVRQPIDRLLTPRIVLSMARRLGFHRIDSVGYVVEPPIVFHFRSRSGRRPFSSKLAWFLAFHPVLALRKTSVMSQDS